MSPWNWLFRRRRREEDLEEEVQSHLRMAARDRMDRGEAEAEARARAIREFGNVALVKEVTRDMWGYAWLETFLQDQHYGLRMLRKNPGFAAVAVLTLAIGIGANTAIFSVVNGVLLRPLPYPEPDRLMMVYEKGSGFVQGSVAYPNYLDWRRANHSFTDLAIYRGDDFNFTGSGQPEHLSGEYVSANLLGVLGVSPYLGRDLLPQEDQEGAAGAALLSYGFWTRRFGADPGILGKSLTLNARSFTVVGVLPPDFRLREQADLYVPLLQWTAIELRSRESHPGFRVVGRLKPGVTAAAAGAEMESIGGELARQYPKENGGRGTTVIGMKSDVVGSIQPTLLLMMGAVGFVLIIACTNVANLLLARSIARGREFAIRVSLGAGRGRVIRQVLTESVQLTLVAAVLGMLLASWGIRLIQAAAPAVLPRSQEIGLDLRMLLFTLAVSVLTGILFGLVPAFHGSNVSPVESLKDGARGSGGKPRRAERVLVAVEVGLAVVLLAGAGLMMQSIWRLLRIDPGFDTRRLLTTQVALSPSVMASPAGIRLSYQQMLERLAAIPGVRSAAVTSLLPLGPSDSELSYWMGSGAQPPQDQTSTAMFYIATTDYLRTMGIPLLSGRFFTDHDTLASAPVVVIDEVMARHLFPGQDALGKQISIMILGPVRIVGVAGHVKHWGLDSDDTAKIRDQIYFPFLQVPDRFMSEGVVGLTLVLRSEPDPLSVVSAVRAQVAGPTADQPIYGVQSMEQVISGSLAERRLTMLLLIIFSSTALMLAAVGIYGVISYAVSRRTHELGVRMALGASRRNVLRLVVREGMLLAGIGTAAGMAAALPLTQFLTNLLYGVRPADPVTFAAVAFLLGAVALLACYVPAWRATRVDPMVALRYE
ncbi:MAG TPA: ABC transporter permease [Acidobacteriota bacterium]|nr:ABC transporter permease [Acidobacteriota bacterium]